MPIIDISWGKQTSISLAGYVHGGSSGHFNSPLSPPGPGDDWPGLGLGGAVQGHAVGPRHSLHAVHLLHHGNRVNLEKLSFTVLHMYTCNTWEYQLQMHDLEYTRYFFLQLYFSISGVLQIFFLSTAFICFWSTPDIFFCQMHLLESGVLQISMNAIEEKNIWVTPDNRKCNWR